MREWGEVTDPTPAQLEIMEHALGVPRSTIKQEPGWRNYYNAPADTDVYPALQEMVGLGMLAQNGDYFFVTDAWKHKIVREWWAARDRTWFYGIRGSDGYDKIEAPTKSKARYLAFLAVHDCLPDIRITDINVYARKPL